MLPVHDGDGAPLPVTRPAAGVRTAAPGPDDGPARHARVVVRVVTEAEPPAVPLENTTVATVIAARAVTVPPWLLPAVSVPLTRSGHFYPRLGDGAKV